MAGSLCGQFLRRYRAYTPSLYPFGGEGMGEVLYPSFLPCRTKAMHDIRFIREGTGLPSTTA